MPIINFLENISETILMHMHIHLFSNLINVCDNAFILFRRNTLRNENHSQYGDTVSVICQLCQRQLCNFRKYCIHSKCSPEHVECSFDSTAENFSLRVRKKILNFLSECFSGHVECSLDNPAENFSPSLKTLKIIWKIPKFQQNCVRSKGSLGW